MKNIKVRFNYFLKKEKENNYLNEYIALAKAVLYQKFPKKDLLESFEKLVPIGMRPESIRKQMIDYLDVLTNRDRAQEKRVGIMFDEYEY